MEHTEPQTDQERRVRPFGATHVIDPTTDHTHTFVMLHGRGSTGEEFAGELFESTLSDGSSLFQRFSGCRWVFPSSQELWSTAFQEDMPAWFEAHSLTDITARQELQMNGIRDSVDHIVGIISEELKRLHGDAQRLALGGISQGGAIALWTLLCQRNSTVRPGTVVVTNTWLPFAATIERLFAGQQDDGTALEAECESFVGNLMAIQIDPDIAAADRDPRTLGAVFVGHGTDDAYVDVELGRQATHVLSQAGLSVEWKEYSGAEEEGHWFKAPEEMDDIFGFLVGAGWSG
ncbi:Alpha/Beta hydrolase protein [Ampelomyces quisqualis]|uniref:Alpha/Beta hydrolase protein n=1 Tax=Ampelomyces quisqualis TaxID=50730 RepID=A0A6A5QP30_AMPQU|nr:Alpha/Beta hydrolase protein [Ampelomyces quisqualis]